MIINIINKKKNRPAPFGALTDSANEPVGFPLLFVVYERNMFFFVAQADKANKAHKKQSERNEMK